MKSLKSVCVYCSASDKVDPIFTKAAKKVGKLLAERNIKLIYGGNKSGLMGSLADSSLENGGYVMGYTTKKLSITDGAHESIQELHIVPDMSSRKKCMYNQAEAFIVLPGGLGTLEELAEIISWKQIRLHNKPIVLLNIDGYWNTLYSLFRNMVDKKFAPSSLWDMVAFVDDTDSIPEALIQQLSIELPSHKWG